MCDERYATARQSLLFPSVSRTGLDAHRSLAPGLRAVHGRVGRTQQLIDAARPAVLERDADARAAPDGSAARGS